MYVESPPDTDELGNAIPSQKWIDVLLLSDDPRERREYIHWDKLRRLQPPSGLSAEEWWWAIKFRRDPGLHQLPLLATDGDSPSYSDGKPFVYSLPDSVLRSLHLIDQHCAGEVAMDSVVTSDGHARERYLVNSLTEEAIRSSQLEGATTSRQEAKALLASGREPRDRSERMIVNNYRALQFMRTDMGDVLTPESVLELHRILTDGTLDDPEAAGRLQPVSEKRVAVYYREGDPPVHRPPHADQLRERLEALCRFANEGDEAHPFIHPVLRAILLHFCLAYDHPFVDGNGRTARILFFWLMRKRGYWLVEYLPISRILQQAPAKYARAFLETETDGGDTTYFILHQLHVVERAVEDMHLYLKRKADEITEVEGLIHGNQGFNHRQLAVLSDALRHPDRTYSFSAHAQLQRVTHETARTDLSILRNRGLLTRRKVGREYIFEPAPDLPTLLKESAA
jgi:Fic family protein